MINDSDEEEVPIHKLPPHSKEIIQILQQQKNGQVLVEHCKREKNIK